MYDGYANRQWLPGLFRVIQHIRSDVPVLLCPCQLIHDRNCWETGFRSRPNNLLVVLLDWLGTTPRVLALSDHLAVYDVVGYLVNHSVANGYNEWNTNSVPTSCCCNRLWSK